MNEKIKPAPYSNTDEAETLAIDTFKILLNHKKVTADIRERDRYPNIDGYLELIDEDISHIGKLEVQVKKLPKYDNGNAKLVCPTTLISYSEISTFPVLLIGVDADQNKAFWFHVNELSKDCLAKGQKTITVTFPKENIIDSSDNYIEKWKKITESYKEKIRDFDKVKESYEKLSEKSNSALGIIRDEFLKIHLFLDSFNGLLENEFQIIKKRFYPYSWKVGLAYYRFEKNLIEYTLYPIPANKNDVQVKEVNEGLHRELKREGLGFTAHYMENPLITHPKNYALEVIESQILRILKNKLLYHGNEFLAKEFIFGFIDKFHQQMGLDKKNTFSIREIEYAFYQYLPVWVDESISFLIANQRNGIKSYRDCLYRRFYFDPDMLISQIMDDEMEKIRQIVKKRLEKNGDIPKIPISNDRFPSWIFTNFLEFLKSLNIKEINRVYPQKDYSRIKGKDSWIWNVYSPKTVKENLNIFFGNLPTVYYDIVRINFPKIKDKLSLFKGASKVIIFFKVREEYKSFQDSPHIKIFYLIDETDKDTTIEIYEEGENREIESLLEENLGKYIEIDGKKYKTISMSSGILDFIYEDLPMFNFVYKNLEENIKNYINSVREN